MPLHHFGHLILLASGFFSYRTLVPTGILANSLPVFGKLWLFLHQFFLFSLSLDFLMDVNHGDVLFLNLHLLSISLGLLFIPGMSVDRNIKSASHAFSAFFIHDFTLWFEPYTLHYPQIGD